MFYLVNSIDEIPSGTEYRVLGEYCPWWNGKKLIEAKEILNLEVAPERFPNGNGVDDVDGCIIEWIKKD